MIGRGSVKAEILIPAIPGVEFPSQPRSNFLVRTSVGTWLSLVEHSLGVRGVGSSNLPVPTNDFRVFLSGTCGHTHPLLLNRPDQ